VWNWVPSIERTIKLSPSMMSQSWMGTDFTNDDLVKEASIVEDYDHAFDGETVIDGRACHIIRLTPKPAAAVVWGKVVLSIDKKDLLMLRAAYYDEDGALVNTLEASDVKLLGGRLLPARLEMTPAGKKGQKTVMIYNALTFDKPIDDAFFTTRNMTTVK
jgi:outer membrane lipoprotein-sorting protein